MRYERTTRFKRAFQTFPESIQRAFYKQAAFLMRDIRHPSLRAKKYDEVRGIWQARVTANARFYFCINGDLCLLLDIRKHAD